MEGVLLEGGASGVVEWEGRVILNEERQQNVNVKG